MADDAINVKLEISGDKEFLRVCDDINKSLRVLAYTIREVSDTFMDNKNASESLRMDQEKLRQELDAQTRKLKETEDALQDMKSKGLDDVAPSIKRMDENLNNLATAMSNSKKETEGVSKESKKLKINWDSVGKSVGAVAKGFGNAFLGLGKMAVDAAAGAKDLSGVLGKNAVDSLTAFDGKMQGLNKSMVGLQGAASLVALPFLDVLASDGISIMDDFSQGLQNADGNMDVMAAVIETALGDAVNLITERLPELVDMGVGIVTALIEGVVDSVPEIAEAAVTIVTSLAEGLLEMLPMLLDGALQLALGIAEGIGEALPELIPTIVELVTELVQVLIDNIPLLMDAAVQIMEGLTQGIIEAIPILVDALPELISSLITALLEAIPQILEAGTSIITALAEALPDIIASIVELLPVIISGIIEALLENLPFIVEAGIDLMSALFEAVPEIVVAIAEAIPKIIAGIGDAFAEKSGDMAAMGLDLIKGLWKGISDAAKWLWEKISGFFSDLTNRIKKFFGINSPSKLFAGFGKNMAEGIGVGFSSKIGSVGHQLRISLRGLTNGLEAELGIAPIQATVAGQYQSVPYLAGAGSAGSDFGASRTGGVQVIQNIYANETSYAGQQKEAARQIGVMARRFAL